MSVSPLVLFIDSLKAARFSFDARISESNTFMAALKSLYELISVPNLCFVDVVLVSRQDLIRNRDIGLALSRIHSEVFDLLVANWSVEGSSKRQSKSLLFVVLQSQ